MHPQWKGEAYCVVRLLIRHHEWSWNRSDCNVALNFAQEFWQNRLQWFLGCRYIIAIFLLLNEIKFSIAETIQLYISLSLYKALTPQNEVCWYGWIDAINSFTTFHCRWRHRLHWEIPSCFRTQREINWIDTCVWPFWSKQAYIELEVEVLLTFGLSIAHLFFFSRLDSVFIFVAVSYSSLVYKNETTRPCNSCLLNIQALAR